MFREDSLSVQPPPNSTSKAFWNCCPCSRTKLWRLSTQSLRPISLSIHRLVWVTGICTNTFRHRSNNRRSPSNVLHGGEMWSTGNRMPPRQSCNMGWWFVGFKMCACVCVCCVWNGQNDFCFEGFFLLRFSGIGGEHYNKYNQFNQFVSVCIDLYG